MGDGRPGMPCLLVSGSGPVPPLDGATDLALRVARSAEFPKPMASWPEHSRRHPIRRGIGRAGLRVAGDGLPVRRTDGGLHQINGMAAFFSPCS